MDAIHSDKVLRDKLGSDMNDELIFALEFLYL